MINGNEYAWEDIQVVIEGKADPIEGITAIEYTTKKDHVNIYGRGDKPVGIGRGKKEFSGKITLLQSELEALQAAMPKGKDITDKTAFGVTVGYAPEVGPAVTDQLEYVRFMEIPKGMKSGDPNKEIEVPIAIGNIKYNV